MQERTSRFLWVFLHIEPICTFRQKTKQPRPRLSKQIILSRRAELVGVRWIDHERSDKVGNKTEQQAELPTPALKILSKSTGTDLDINKIYWSQLIPCNHRKIHLKMHEQVNNQTRASKGFDMLSENIWIMYQTNFSFLHDFPSKQHLASLTTSRFPISYYIFQDWSGSIIFVNIYPVLGNELFENTRVHQRLQSTFPGTDALPPVRIWQDPITTIMLTLKLWIYYTQLLRWVCNLVQAVHSRKILSKRLSVRP